MISSHCFVLLCIQRKTFVYTQLWHMTKQDLINARQVPRVLFLIVKNQSDRFWWQGREFDKCQILLRIFLATRLTFTSRKTMHLSSFSNEMPNTNLLFLPQRLTMLYLQCSLVYIDPLVQGFSTRCPWTPKGPWWPTEGVHMIFFWSNTFVADQR